MEVFLSALQPLFDRSTAILAQMPQIGAWYTAFVRFLFPVLACLILAGAVRSLLKIPHTPEAWARLSLPGGTPVLLTHWENIVGRAETSDVVLNFPVVSRQHAALIRAEDGAWTVHDLGSSGGTQVNGKDVQGAAPVTYGDTVSFGGIQALFTPVTREERRGIAAGRRAVRPTNVYNLSLIHI